MNIALHFSGKWGQKYNPGGVAAFHVGKRLPYKVMIIFFMSDPSQIFNPPDTSWHSSKSAVQPAMDARCVKHWKAFQENSILMGKKAIKCPDI